MSPTEMVPSRLVSFVLSLTTGNQLLWVFICRMELCKGFRPRCRNCVSIPWGLRNGPQWLGRKGRDRTEKQERTEWLSQHLVGILCSGEEAPKDLGFHASPANTLHLLGNFISLSSGGG